MASEYGGITFLSHPLVVEVILPFLLVFTVVFGILQKSEIFGNGKKQIDAIVALVIGLLVISFVKNVEIIVYMSAFIATALIVVLVFFLLVGSFHKEGDTDEIFGKVKWVVGVPMLIAFFASVLYIVGIWDFIWENIIVFGSGSDWIMNIVFVLIIAGAIWVVLRGAGSSGGESEKPSS